jgi:hypothetical protein
VPPCNPAPSAAALPTASVPPLLATSATSSGKGKDITGEEMLKNNFGPAGAGGLGAGGAIYFPKPYF